MIPALILVAAVAAQSPAPAPATRLVYVPPAKLAGSCPTKAEVEEGVARRLGTSPFSEPAKRVVVLSLQGDDLVDGKPPKQATVELYDADLQSLGARTLESGGGCTDLVEAAELAISIALAPGLALGPVAPPAPVPVPVPVPAPKPEPLAPEAEPPAVSAPVETSSSSLLPPGVHLLVGAGLDASLLLGPDAAAGPSISAALRAGEVELRLERHEHIPGFDTQLLVVHGAGVFTAAGCAHLPLFSVLGAGDDVEISGCPTASLGDVWGIGAYIGGGPYVGAGGRVGGEWRLGDLSSFRAWAQVEWSIVRPSFIAVNGAPPWTQDAPVNVAFGIAYELPWAL